MATKRRCGKRLLIRTRFGEAAKTPGFLFSTEGRRRDGFALSYGARMEKDS
jgi:hypothetical protein